MKRQPVQSEEMPAFIGIDYHKAYSVYSVLDAQGESLGQGPTIFGSPQETKYNVPIRSTEGHSGQHRELDFSFGNALCTRCKRLLSLCVHRRVERAAPKFALLIA